MSRHTKGPWHMESGPSKTMTGEPADWRITSDKGTVAMLYDGDTCGPRYERDSNALLIAAAPDLLTALKDARVIIAATPVEKRNPAIVAGINAAIARAEGTHA